MKVPQSPSAARWWWVSRGWGGSRPASARPLRWRRAPGAAFVRRRARKAARRCLDQRGNVTLGAPAVPSPCLRCSPWGWGFPMPGHPRHAAPLSPHPDPGSTSAPGRGSAPVPASGRNPLACGVRRVAERKMADAGGREPAPGGRRPPARDKCHLAHGCTPPRRRERSVRDGEGPGLGGSPRAVPGLPGRWAALAGGGAPPLRRCRGERLRPGGWERGSRPRVAGTGTDLFGSSLPYGKSITDCFHAI